MPIAKEKSVKQPKVKLKAVTKDKQQIRKLVALTDYRPEGWFAVVYDEDSNETLYAELSANEQSAYEAAIAEIQRIKIVADGFAVVSNTDDTAKS
jgi:hypothetical protein